MRPIFPLACTLLLLTACKTVTPVATPAPTQTVPADDNLNAVAWVQTSVEYKALTTQTYRNAAARLDEALNQTNWDALAPNERANATTGLKPAVVLDIDETVLDNSAYQARLVRSGKDFDSASWNQWVDEKQAKAIPGVVDFARAANAKGVTLIYITNRKQEQKDATIANLKAVGLPVASNDVVLGAGTKVDGCDEKSGDKNCRRRLIGQQYRVLMQFGDQLGDFVKIATNTRAGRDALYAEYGNWFGERWFVLPGPTYGSWEPALFNNDWKQSRDARRQAKRDALDVAP
jgi:acid phosphatase